MGLRNRYPGTMAGGTTTQELVAAGSAAGALGSFGFAYTQPEEMKRRPRGCAQDRPARVGHQPVRRAAAETIEPRRRRGARRRDGYYAGAACLPGSGLVRMPKAGGQIAAVEEIRPRVFSTSRRGFMPQSQVKKLKALGILSAKATSVAEPKESNRSASNRHRAGRRGRRAIASYCAISLPVAPERSREGIIVRAVKLPVVAAGGIMDGAGIAAVLALGAKAAQLGTAFSLSGKPARARSQGVALGAREDEKQITEKFSRQARGGLANR